jgi:HEPN/Toprim N-terminal domain 1
MGSMIHLAVGRLELDWGKNSGFTDHSALFQGERDVSDVPYYYAGDEDGIDFEGHKKWKTIVEFKEGMQKPLMQVIDRLNLLGHTHSQCENEFACLAQFNGFNDSHFTFAMLQDVLASVDVTSLSANYGDGGEEFGKFFRRELAPRLGFNELLKNTPNGLHNFCKSMENLSAYTVLHLLARNPQSISLPVQWAFNDVDIGGYARRDEFVRSLNPQSRFLIVTEGSSDAKILNHALNLLRPHVADFFTFVDMEEGYPFSGTGNVYRFVQGLIGIAVQNKILVLFDNDAEGMSNHRRCSSMNVPSNMRILSLPELSEFKAFPTIGPDGESLSDINGRAAAIECYLDLGKDARTRWTSFNQTLGVYQGELEGKTRYMKDFLDQRQSQCDYDYTRLQAILDVLVAGAVSISEPIVATEWLSDLEASDD